MISQNNKGRHTSIIFVSERAISRYKCEFFENWPGSPLKRTRIQLWANPQGQGHRHNTSAYFRPSLDILARLTIRTTPIVLRCEEATDHLLTEIQRTARGAMKIGADTTRVPVLGGHTVKTVLISSKNQPPPPEDCVKALRAYLSELRNLN
ncbi:hypothetical protein PSHT_10394 [Puccinia striiformis]|uniref:Uncharacterized protein n=1 Tax=Puccinia striiformis TaxID=27350 RepID=A0A2S4V9Y5_9BASI|nr:hypothetical protein PSHT_10394 [Puccinia striiformis]